MRSNPLLKTVNVVLAVVFVGVLLGCGGDPVDPLDGTMEANLQGRWVSEPIAQSDTEGKTSTARTMDVHCFHDERGPNGIHTYGSFTETTTPRDVTIPVEKTESHLDGFTFDGLTAKTLASQEDGSVWLLRIDSDNADVMYVTWTLKDGTKRLDEVKFRKQ